MEPQLPKATEASIGDAIKLQAIEVLAEYLVLAPTLKATDEPERYQRANQLVYWLAMVLPADLYRHLAKALIAPDQDANPLTVLERARVWCGVGVGELTSANMLGHAPGIGKQR